MKSLAKIIMLNKDIEEEATIKINQVEFTVFIAYSPYPINVNKEYPVNISFFIDEMEVNEEENEIKGFNRIDNTFEYVVNGYLNDNGKLDVGFIIEDKILEDYHYLYGKYITFKVDRIEAEFL